MIIDQDLKAEDKRLDHLPPVPSSSSADPPAPPPPAYVRSGATAASSAGAAREGSLAAGLFASSSSSAAPSSSPQAVEEDMHDQPPPTVGTYDPAFEQDVKHSSPSSSATTAGSPSGDQPVLLPPLYPPSACSPFLAAYPPSLALVVPAQSFLAFIHALNEALAPNGFQRADRALNNTPVVGLAYGLTKSIVGGISFGLARTAVSIAEGGQGKVGAKLSKAQAAVFGRTTTLPSRVHSLLASANGPSGLFPPSSNLQLVLVPFALLPRVLHAYEPLDGPPKEALVFAAEQPKGDGKTGEKNAERKAARVRRRINYRKWAWLELDGPDGGQAPSPSPSSTSSASVPGATRSPTTSSSSASAPPSAQRQGFLTHVDHKLAARDSRLRGPTTNRPQSSSTSGSSGVIDGTASDGGQAEAGYAWGSGMGLSGTGADDVLFVVVCRRDVDLTR